jgi:hypothetical protein
MEFVARLEARLYRKHMSHCDDDVRDAAGGKERESKADRDRTELPRGGFDGSEYDVEDYFDEFEFEGGDYAEDEQEERDSDEGESVDSEYEGAHGRSLDEHHEFLRSLLSWYEENKQVTPVRLNSYIYLEEN